MSSSQLYKDRAKFPQMLLAMDRVTQTIDGLEILVDAITAKDQKMREFVNAILRGEV